MNPTNLTLEIFSAHAGGAYWKSLTNRFERAGIRVIEHYGVTDAEYRESRSPLSKLTLRWRMYASYPLSTVMRLLTAPKRDASVRLVITSPFYLPALIALTAKEPPPVINLVNDVFPEALVYASMIPERGVLERTLSLFARFALLHCSASVFLGKNLRDLAIKRYGKPPSASIIPVGSEGSWFKTPPQASSPGESLSLLYSGAMGHMHEIETLARLLENDFPQDVEFHFHSFGTGYEKLKKRVPASIKAGPHARFEGALDHQDWVDAMESHPIALITLRRGAERVSFPSKTFSALMAGQAILAICSKESDLASMIIESNCGWIVEPGEVQELHELLASLPNRLGEIDIKRQNAFRLGHRHYSIECVQKQWTELFEHLASQQPRNPAII